MKKDNNFFEDVVYNLVKNYCYEGITWWLKRQDLEEVKQKLKNEEDIVLEIKKEWKGEVGNIPSYFRSIIVTYIPGVKERLARDLVGMLESSQKFSTIVDIKKSFLVECIIRLINIVIIRIKDLEKNA